MWESPGNCLVDCRAVNVKSGLCATKVSTKVQQNPCLVAVVCFAQNWKYFLVHPYNYVAEDKLSIGNWYRNVMREAAYESWSMKD